VGEYWGRNEMVGTFGIVGISCVSAIGGYILIDSVLALKRDLERRRRKNDQLVVAHSARLVSAWRALESERDGSDALFSDSLASVLSGKAALKRAKEKNAENPDAGARIVVRTKYFDDWLETALNEDPDLMQLVILGAGMDTRAYRMKCLKNVVVFELDHHEVLKVKQSLLKSHRASAGGLPALPCCRGIIRISCDLSCHESTWMRDLLLAGFNPTQRSAWILEGVLYYLSEESVDRLVGNLADLSAPGSRMIASVVLKLSQRQQERIRESERKLELRKPPQHAPEWLEHFALELEAWYFWAAEIVSLEEFYPSSTLQGNSGHLADVVIDLYLKFAVSFSRAKNSVLSTLENIEISTSQPVNSNNVRLGDYFQWACPRPQQFIESFGLIPDECVHLGDSKANFGRISGADKSDGGNTSSSLSNTVYISFHRHPRIVKQADPELPLAQVTKSKTAPAASTSVRKSSSLMDGIPGDQVFSSPSRASTKRVSGLPKQPKTGTMTPLRFSKQFQSVSKEVPENQGSAVTGMFLASVALGATDANTASPRTPATDKKSGADEQQRGGIAVENFRSPHRKEDTIDSGSEISNSRPNVIVEENSRGVPSQVNQIEEITRLESATTSLQSDINRKKNDDSSLTLQSLRNLSPKAETNDDAKDVDKIMLQLNALQQIVKELADDDRMSIATRPTFGGFGTPPDDMSLLGSGKAILRLQVKIQHTSLVENGSELRIVGSERRLGLWDASLAPVLYRHSRRRDLFTEEIIFGAEDIVLEYKYVLVSPYGIIRWEPGPNRFCEIHADEVLVVNDITRFA